MNGAPIGHYKTFKTPFVFENICKQMLIFGGIVAIDLVIGAHDSIWFGLLDGFFESRQINLTQDALAQFGTHHQALRFLVVDGEVFERSTHPLALDALDEGRTHLTSQIGVFREVFEIAATERRALHVDPWPQDDIHTLGNTLLAQRLAHAGN